jgi:toxin ParE1/3/4
MSAKSIVPREQANRDIEAAIDYYIREAGETAALGLIDATEAAFRSIARNPAIGSPRYAHELDLPGLRTQSLRRYPYLVFYVEQNDHIDVWRVLHAHRDIPAWMHDPQGD